MNLRARLAALLDPTPERIAARQYDLLLKSARRCMHDLAHCADDAGAPRPFMTAGEWHQRVNEWHRVFYPDGGPKDYAARISNEYEAKIFALHRIMRANGLDPHDGDIPF